jgi:hypothetical protein
MGEEFYLPDEPPVSVMKIYTRTGDEGQGSDPSPLGSEPSELGSDP